MVREDHLWQLKTAINGPRGPSVAAILGPGGPPTATKTAVDGLGTPILGDHQWHDRSQDIFEFHTSAHCISHNSPDPFIQSITLNNIAST